MIDLMKINIEGGEYALLPHLIDTGVISRVRNIQIQFHELDVDSAEKRESIICALRKTHKRDWCYEFVWESWSLQV